MDTLAALALATERPGPELFDRPPHGRFSSLITFKMWRLILIHAAFQTAVLLGLFYNVDHIELLDCKLPPNPSAEQEREFEVCR